MLSANRSKAAGYAVRQIKVISQGAIGHRTEITFVSDNDVSNYRAMS
jgi:hypothetical protein